MAISFAKIVENSWRLAQVNKETIFQFQFILLSQTRNLKVTI